MRGGRAVYVTAGDQHGEAKAASPVLPTLVRRTLKQDALPITRRASLTRPPRLVFALSDVASLLEIAAT